MGVGEGPEQTLISGRTPMVARSCVGVGLTPGVGAGAPPLGTTPGLLLWVELVGSEVR